MSHFKIFPTCLFIFVLSMFGNAMETDPLHSSLNTLIQHPKLSGSIIGISVLDSDKKSLFQHQENFLMIPASTLKVITTFVALDQLGEQFKYETLIGYEGTIDRSGTLNGNLWIVGSGDPSLASPRDEIGYSMDEVFEMVYAALLKNNISCIEGELIFYTGRFDHEVVDYSWPWSDVGNYYGGGVSGINFRENEYDISFNTTGKLKENATINSVYPEVPGLKIDSRVQIDKRGTGDNAYIFGGPENLSKIIRGTLPQGFSDFKIKGALPNSAEFFAHHFTTYLNKKGYGFSEYSITSSTPPPLNIIRKIESPTLKKLVTIANEKSINLYCEAFLKTLSPAGNREKSISIINKLLLQYKLDTLGLSMKDGSGLSPRNYVSPSFFTAFLHRYKEKWGIIKSSSLLPRVSYNGTVKGLLRKSPAEGSAHLKSGYIGGVLTYVGYMKNKKGKWFSVAFMVNQFRCKTAEVRSILEQIIEEIYISS